MLSQAPVTPYIPVSDVRRAREFYEKKIGLRPKAEPDPEGGIAYACGDDSVIYLYKSVGAGTSKASQAFWTVDNLEKEVADLKARGVVFEEYDMPGLKTKNGILEGGGAAWFKDSEGNIMAVIERVKS